MGPYQSVMKNKLETAAHAPSEDFTRRGHGIGAQLFSSVSHFKGAFSQHHLQELNSEEAEVSVEENLAFHGVPGLPAGTLGLPGGPGQMYLISGGGNKSPKFSRGRSTAAPWGWAMFAREEPQPAALALPEPAQGQLSSLGLSETPFPLL